MSFKYLVAILFISTAVQANTLSETVMAEKLKQKENYVFSNTSVDGLLSLISFGLGQKQQNELVSYWNGTSLENKAKDISALKEQSPGVSVLVGYQIWVDQKYNLLPSYISDVSSKFSVVPEIMDVNNKSEVVDSVNSWAADNTNNLITKVINQDFVTPDLATILANAIYFKGEWKDKFNEALTEPKDFHGAGLVDTMTSGEAYNFAYNEKDKVVVLELPFKGDKYSMIIAMPAQYKEYDYDDENYQDPGFSYKSGKRLQRIFKDYIINSKANSELEKSNLGGDLFLEIPKFTIETEIKSIEDKLNQVGLSSLFAAGALSNMSSENLQISEILQKAKIIVNEEGAEAAAVTIGGMEVVSAPMVTSMKINGPFSYMIRNNENNERVFEGIVFNPAN